MPRLIDLTGQPFGELIVLNRVGSVHTSSLWLCQCSCGRTTETTSGRLRSGDTRSCGQCEYAASRRSTSGKTWKCKNTLPPGQITRNATLKNYQRNAKKRGFVWEISSELFNELTRNNCFYCGSPPMNKRHTTGDPAPFIYNGIDRKDSGRGYTPDNVVSCCKICNRAKSNLPFTDWLVYLDRVRNYVMVI